MPISSLFSRKKRCQHAEFSVEEGRGGCQFNIHSVETLRSLFLKHKPLRYKPLVALLGTTLRHRVMIVADGDDWQKTQRAINPEFATSLVAGQYAPVIVQTADQAFAALARQPPTETGELAIDVEPLMRAVTCSVLGHILFGETLGTDEAARTERTLGAATQVVPPGLLARLNRGVGATLQAVGLAQYQPYLLPRVQRRAVRELLAWIKTRIAQAEQLQPLPPLLASLQRRYAHRRPARQRQAIAAEYAMLFIAGIETTASALTFAIAEIATHPAVREQAIHEARQSSTPDANTQPVATQFPYLHCVLRETLRRHTIVPTLLRETETDYRPTAGPQSGPPVAVPVRKGATLRYLPLQGHMRRTVWESPLRFDPTRFSRPLTPEQSRHYVPFGFGPQRCPGHAMATTESILILRAFFRHFDLDTQPLAANIREKRNVVFTNRPIGVLLRVRPAQSA
jgi:cytochrome P450